MIVGTFVSSDSRNFFIRKLNGKNCLRKSVSRDLQIFSVRLVDNLRLKFSKICLFEKETVCTANS